jgi:hypothetical protein
VVWDAQPVRPAAAPPSVRFVCACQTTDPVVWHAQPVRRRTPPPHPTRRRPTRRPPPWHDSGVPPSPSAAEQQLRGIARAATDASGYFPALYARVTARVGERAAAGGFDDPARMDRFVACFAGYYVRAFEREVAPPRCWQATWDVAGQGDLLIVQHLLLGINAHVNHDLALAVVELADDAGDLAALRPDFDAINDVLAETYALVLRDLDRVSRWVNLAATLGGSRLFNFSLEVARDRAWGAAVRLHPLGPAERAAYRAELDDLVSVLAYLVTRPPPLVRPLVAVARRLEEHDPRRVTAALLDERGT